MRVTQTISIGTLRINSMSNSSIVQVGASGAIKARSEDIKENVTQAQADKKLEKKIHKEIDPLMKKEGLPAEPPTGPQQPGGKATGASAGGTNGGGTSGTNMTGEASPDEATSTVSNAEKGTDKRTKENRT